MRHRYVWRALAAAFALHAAGAVAQNALPDYPSKPVRLVVPTSPGGGVDLVSRLAAQLLTERWRQQVIVDNRGGASGIIGTELAARAPADGYTLLVVPTTYSVNPALFARLPYDPAKDFAAVSLLSKEPNVLLVHPSLPARSVSELVALSKRAPQQLNYGYGGAGSSSNLSAELLKLRTGAKGVGISYKSAGPAVTALLAGETQMMFVGLPPTLSSVRAGKLRALAVTSRERSPLLPDTPTMAQSGVPDFEVTNWIGMLAPAGTNASIVKRVNATVAQALASPEAKERMLTYGMTPDTSTPEAFGGFVKTEIARWRDVVAQAHLTVN